jgi:hypothetical protein
MAWCEANGLDYIFGHGDNEVLDRQVEADADDVRVRYAEGEAPVRSPSALTGQSRCRPTILRRSVPCRPAGVTQGTFRPLVRLPARRRACEKSHTFM